MTALVQLCVVRVGADDFAIDLRRVDEILLVPTLTPVPQAPSFLEGVVRVRDEVLPVVDVRKRLLGAAPRDVAPKVKRKERLVVCRIGRRRVGFIVDAVTQVARASRAELKAAPLTGRPGRTAHVVATWGDGPRLKLLLDLKALLEESPA